MWNIWPTGGATEKLGGSGKSVGFIIWEPRISAANFMAIQSIVLEIFQPGSKRWTDWWQPDIDIRGGSMASIAKNPPLCQQYFCMTGDIIFTAVWGNTDTSHRLNLIHISCHVPFMLNAEPLNSYEILYSSKKSLHYWADCSDVAIDQTQLDLNPSEPGLVK